MTFTFEKDPVLTGHAPQPGDMTGQQFGKEEYYAILVLCVLCLVVFFFQLGSHPLWDVDEGMHASTSKDMVLSGDWVTTRVNGKNFYDKTVLFNWFAALSFLVFGFTEFAARMPAALLGLGTVLVTYLLGRRLFGPRAGLLGGVVLATGPEFIVLSRSVMHDISLAFFITLALSFFFIAFSTGHRRGVNLVLFYASLGFAVLAKGPIGLLLPGLIIGLFLLVKGRLAFLKEMSLGWGALVFLAVAAPWYVLISIRNEDYASYFFLKQNFGNFLSKVQAHHPEHFYYYVPVLLGGMLPWSFFVPLAVVRPLRQGLRNLDDGVLFLLLWFSVIFLFFSAANSKLATYILPAFPAVALLVGRLWHEMMTTTAAGLRKGIGWSLAPLPVLFLAATIYIMVKRPEARKLQTLYGMSLQDMSGLLIALTVDPFHRASFLPYPEVLVLLFGPGSDVRRWDALLHHRLCPYYGPLSFDQDPGEGNGQCASPRGTAGLLLEALGLSALLHEPAGNGSAYGRTVACLSGLEQKDPLRHRAGKVCEVPEGRRGIPHH